MSGVRRLIFSLFVIGVGLLGSGIARSARAEEPAAPPPDLKVLLDGYRNLQAAPRGIDVHERIARIGHLEILFNDGEVFPLKSPEGEVLGIYFQGHGRYTYRSEDPADRRVIDANVTRETKAPIYYQYAVRDNLERAVLFFASPALGDLATSPASGGGEAPKLSDRERAAFGTIWKRVMQTYLECDHLAASARLNQIGQQYVYAEMEGGRETIGYSFDRVADFKERLFLFRKIQGVDIRFERQLSEQPIDGGPSGHPPAITLKDARIEVATEDNRSATIVSDLTFESSADGVSVIRLGLMNNRDPYHYNWASPKNRLVVRRVTDESGRDLPFSHEYHQILLQLPKPLERGQTFRLHFDTAGEVLTDMHGERHDNYFNLFFDPWFPRPLRWNSAGTTFALKVRTRKPFVPIASGATASFRESGEYYELETTSARPASMIVVFAGKYVTREGTFDGTTIRVHAYAAARGDLLDRMPRIANQFLRFYEKSLGPYPFGDLDIVEAPDFLHYGTSSVWWGGFGISPSGLVLVSSNAFNPRKFVPTLEALRQQTGEDRPWNVSRGMTQLLAHEIAHQWFPHKAMPLSSRDYWLSESFAEYLSGLAIAAANPDEREAEGFPTLFADWQFRARACKDVGSLEAADMLSGPDAYRDYVCLLYARGPLVLHMLRAMAGNDRFFAILRRYLDRANMGTVTTDDFRKAAEEVMQADLGWFFDDWYRQGGIPEIRVKYDVTPAGGGRYVLAGRAEQAGGPGFRRILIPLVVDYGDGRPEARLVFQDEPVEQFRFELQGKPKKVAVDPGQNNLAVYH